MRKPAPSTANSLIPHRYTTIILILTIAAGIIGSGGAAWLASRYNRNLLQQRAQDVANAISADTVSTLTGTSADLDTPAYRDLKNRLNRIRSDGPEIRFAYIAGKDDKGLFLYANSEPITSANYRGPGERLSDASEQMVLLDSSRVPFTEGPNKDEWGSFISGVAPIIDNNTGEYIGAVGIDMPASQYYLTNIGAALIPLMLVSFPLIAIIRDRRVEQRERDMMQLRTQFVSVASHELRSPLSGMLWAVQSLLKPSVKNLTIEQQVILLDMYQSAEESLATINEILDLSALEKDKPQNHNKQRVEIGNIIKTATKTLRLSANERGIKFTFVGNWNGDDCYTVGDPSALKRMFMNLIANAIKYGKNDTEINIRLTTKDDVHLIAIEDHGIGIPASDQKKVLDGYYRAKNAQETQRAGTGLGLLLAKLVAEQHNGKLWLTSKEGRGTTVFVSLPVDDGQTQQEKPSKR